MYERLAQFAQVWGMFYIIALFGVVLVYALWPRNQAKFERAARAPLEDDDAPDLGPSPANLHGDARP